MAQVQFESPIAEMNGKYSTDGTIFRRKKYRSSSGIVLRSCKQEAYVITNPRDFKKKPPKGAELANMNRFGEAHRKSIELIQAGKVTPEEMESLPANERTKIEQLRAQLAAYQHVGSRPASAGSLQLDGHW